MDLTIILTTSPIISNPSTLLLENVIETFHYGGPEFSSCRKLLVCDGFREQSSTPPEDPAAAPTVTKRHTTAKSAMRSGIVDSQQKANYEQFKENIRARVAAAEHDPADAFHNMDVLELSERNGYGFALKSALQLVTTKYVCVIQHDRTFMRRTPMKEVVAAMEANDKVKYVGILMRSNLLYLEHFLGKYGSEMSEQLQTMFIRPPELLLERKLYASEEVSRDLTDRFANCGDKYAELRKTYMGSIPYRKLLGEDSTLADYLAPRCDGTAEDAACASGETGGTPTPPPPPQTAKAATHKQATLIPTLFWYDNIHVVNTSHYRDWVFDPLKHLVARGGFVEDKLSPAMVALVQKRGLQEGHAPFGCYLLDDHCGVAFTGHLDGGTFLTPEQKKKLHDEKGLVDGLDKQTGKLKKKAPQQAADSAEDALADLNLGVDDTQHEEEGK